MDYPKMIYLGGDLSAEWRIVDDADAEAVAEKDGFFAHERKRAANPDAPAADASQEDVPARKKPGPKPKAKP